MTNCPARRGFVIATKPAVAKLQLPIYNRPAMNKSKTDQAIDYMLEHGVSAYAAARVFGITTKPIYHRIKLLEDRSRCECCGQLLPQRKEVTK